MTNIAVTVKFEYQNDPYELETSATPDISRCLFVDKPIIEKNPELFATNTNDHNEEALIKLSFIDTDTKTR